MTEDDGGRFPYRLVFAGVLVAILVWFGFANSARVKVDWIVTTRHSRLIFVILGPALLGFVAGWLVGRRGRD